MIYPLGIRRFALLLLVFFSSLQAAKAEILTELREAGLKLVLSANSNDDTYDFSFLPEEKTRREITPNVFFVENPNRLVLDFIGLSAKSQRSINIPNGAISHLRIGQHPDRFRIVLDLRGDSLPSFDIARDQRTLATVVHIAFDGLSTSGAIAPSSLRQSPIVSPFDKPKAESESPSSTGAALDDFAEAPLSLPSRASPSGASSSSEVLGLEHSLPEENSTLKLEQLKGADDLVSPEEAQKSLEQEIASATREQKAGEMAIPAEGKAIVKAIYYQSPKNSSTSSVKIDVDGLSTYSLHQLDSGHFQLLLSNAMLAGSYLSLPQFPPDTFAGFEVISARSKDNNTIIDIYVEKGINLSPYMAQGKLWLKASK